MAGYSKYPNFCKNLPILFQDLAGRQAALELKNIPRFATAFKLISLNKMLKLNDPDPRPYDA
mgnify:CR=1 FL=1